MLVTSTYDAYWRIMELCAPNKLEYCLRHGFQFQMRRHTKYTPWGQRTDFMRETLEQMDDGDWLWFMDTDTVITNMTVKLESILTPNAPDMIVCKDMHGVNNGVFFLRKSAATVEFLRTVKSMNTAYSDDQSAMVALLNQGVISVRYAEQDAFNSYLFDEYGYYKGLGLTTESLGHWRPGRFVLHLPGMTNRRREMLMQEKLKEVVR